jgi:hypothetical protein
MLKLKATIAAQLSNKTELASDFSYEGKGLSTN